MTNLEDVMDCSKRIRNHNNISAPPPSWQYLLNSIQLFCAQLQALRCWVQDKGRSWQQPQKALEECSSFISKTEPSLQWNSPLAARNTLQVLFSGFIQNIHCCGFNLLICLSVSKWLCCQGKSSFTLITAIKNSQKRGLLMSQPTWPVFALLNCQRWQAPRAGGPWSSDEKQETGSLV